MNDERSSPGAGLLSGGSIDPVRMARRDLAKARPRRFYEHVSVDAGDAGFEVRLDGKPILTPAKARLVVPTPALADALAAEWRAQSDVIDPTTMPMTRLVNSAIDSVAPAREATITEVAKFAETDLVCYRADGPPALVEAQRIAWDPVLAFAREALRAPLQCATGVIFRAQPEGSLAAIRREVEALARGPRGHLRLSALALATNLTGSVLLALMVSRGKLAVDAAWRAAHVDEDYQMSVWGADREALGRREARWLDMDAAARLGRLAIL